MKISKTIIGDISDALEEIIEAHDGCDSEKILIHYREYEPSIDYAKNTFIIECTKCKFILTKYDLFYNLYNFYNTNIMGIPFKLI